MTRLDRILKLLEDYDRLANHPRTYRTRLQEKELMIDYNFIPETLEWCTTHYTPPIKSYIHCPGFGNTDGTDGSCWHCMEMTPYQHVMCCDESWLRGLLSPYSRCHCNTREEAAEFIENHKTRE